MNPLKTVLQVVVTSQGGFWETNSCFLEVKRGLLITETSLLPLKLKLKEPIRNLNYLQMDPLLSIDAVLHIAGQ